MNTILRGYDMVPPPYKHSREFDSCDNWSAHPMPLALPPPYSCGCYYMYNGYVSNVPRGHDLISH